jgi:hypothetical protein
VGKTIDFPWLVVLSTSIGLWATFPGVHAGHRMDCLIAGFCFGNLAAFVVIWLFKKNDVPK